MTKSEKEGFSVQSERKKRERKKREKEEEREKEKGDKLFTKKQRKVSYSWRARDGDRQ